MWYRILYKEVFITCYVVSNTYYVVFNTICYAVLIIMLCGLGSDVMWYPLPLDKVSSTI